MNIKHAERHANSTMTPSQDTRRGHARSSRAAQSAPHRANNRLTANAQGTRVGDGGGGGEEDARETRNLRRDKEESQVIKELGVRVCASENNTTVLGKRSKIFTYSIIFDKHKT